MIHTTTRLPGRGPGWVCTKAFLPDCPFLQLFIEIILWMVMQTRLKKLGPLKTKPDDALPSSAEWNSIRQLRVSAWIHPSEVSFVAHLRLPCNVCTQRSFREDASDAGREKSGTNNDNSKCRPKDVPAIPLYQLHQSFAEEGSILLKALSRLPAPGQGTTRLQRNGLRTGLEHPKA